MATISNIINTLFTSTGASDVAGDADRISRSQTRLGQASASAGRQFAAQASGLGGLVGAYAGAAATVFALQAAFTALANAARAAQTMQGLNTLAAETGAGGQALLASVREITKNQLTLTETAQQLNLSLSAGFNTSQIEGLSEVALKASRALGRDLNDAYTRVVRGSAKMETELLDELGIYTKIEPATRAYAAAIGKSVGSLSEFERRQAFVNAVIEEGQRKFSGINTTIPSAAEQIEAFGVKIQDLSTQIGILLAEAIAPLASFLTNNLAGAFSALGIILSLVASKGITLLTAGTQALTASIVSGGLSFENFIRRLTGTAQAAQTATTALTRLAESNIALTGTQKDQLVALQTTARARKLSSIEISKSTALINNNITALQGQRAAIASTAGAQIAAARQAARDVRQARQRVDAARALPQGAGFGSPEFVRRTTEINRANRALRDAQAAQTALKPSVDQLRTSIVANTQALVQNRAALTAIAPAATGASFALTALGVAATRAVASFVAGYTTLFTGIVAAASRIFFVVTLFTLIGSSIAGALGKGQEFEGLLSRIGNNIKGVFTDETSKNVKNAIQGIGAANFQQLENANQELRNIEEFKFTKKFLFFDVEVTKTKDQLVSEVNSLITDVFSGTQRSVADSATSGAAIAGSIVGNIAAGLVRFIPGIGPVVGTVFGATIARAVGTAVGGAIGGIWDYFSDVPEVDPAVREAIKKEFTAALTGIDDAVQDKLATVIASLRDRYGEAAKIDPAARVALKTQERLVLASAAYLENIESVAGIMIATGQTADIIAKNFTFEKAVNGIDYISKALTTINGTTFEFQFIDTESAAFQNLIATPKVVVDLDDNSLNDVRSTIITDVYKIFDDLESTGIFNLTSVSRESLLESVLGSVESNTAILDSANITTLLQDLSELAGLTAAEVAAVEQSLMALEKTTDSALKPLRVGPVDVKDSFLELVGSINLFQESSLRTGEILRSLNTGLLDGSLDVERFSQAFNNASTALVVAERQFGQTQTAIDSLRSKITTEQDPMRRAELTIELLTYERIRDSVLAQIIAQKELLSVIEEQGKALNIQEKISKFFKSFEVKDFDELTLDLNIRVAGLSDVEKFVGTIAILKEGAAITAAQLDLYKDIGDQLKNLNLLDTEIANILANGNKDLDDLVIRLNSVEGVTASIETNAGEAFLKIATGSTEAGNRVEEFINTSDLAATAVTAFGIASKEAVENFVKQSFQQIPGLLDSALKDVEKLRKDIVQELADIEFQRYELSVSARLDAQAFQTDLDLLRANAKLEKLELQVELVGSLVNADKISKVDGAKQENTLQREILAQRERILTLEFRQTMESLDRRKTEAELAASRERDLIKLDIDAQRQKIMADQAYITAIITAYQSIFEQNKSVNDDLLQGLVVNGNIVADTWAQTFYTGGSAIGTAIAQAIALQPINPPQVTGGTGQSVLTTGVIEIAPNALDDFNTKTSAALADLTKLESKRIDLVNEGLDATIAGIENQRTLETERYNNNVNNLRTQGIIEANNAIAREKDARESGGGDDKKLSYLREKLKELFDSIKGNIENALMGLNNLIFYGEGNINEIFGNLFKSIQQDFFKTTIADPLSGFLTDSLFSMAGITGMRTGIENAEVENGALLVKLIEGPAELLNIDTKKPIGAKDSILDKSSGKGITEELTETTKGIFSGFFNQITSLFSNIFGQNGILAGLFKGLMGEGGILSGLFKGIGGFFTSLLGFSQGGLVHLAAGGAAASASLNRDRVPAMLEPGEFVIRKQSAERIGMPALQAMNATGNAGAPGNVYVNVTNEGTGKTVEQSQPRFDGEKYVVDIVMRDFANNGPIRRTLRGRGGI